MIFFLFFTKVCVCNGYFGIAMSHLLCKKNVCDVCGGGVGVVNSQSITTVCTRIWGRMENDHALSSNTMGDLT